MNICSGHTEQNMFLRRNRDALPIFGDATSNRGSNGVEGIQTVNRMVLFSIGWVITSIIVFIFGIYHCRSNSYNYQLKCNPSDCTWIKSEYGVSESISFPRTDFLQAEAVRINWKGEFVETSAMKPKLESYGHSIRLKVRLPAEPESKIKIERAILLTPHDMGRRTARSATSRFQGYLSKVKDSALASDSRSVTFIGLLSCFFGLISLVLAFVFGQWADKPPRKIAHRGGKKAS